MYERDYLLRLIYLLVESIRRSWITAQKKDDPAGAAEMLEAAIGEATEIDGAILLSLSPESMASILQVSGTDPRVIEYVARSLELAAAYQRDAGNDALGALRHEQAQALAQAFGLEIPDSPEELSDLPELDEIDE